MSAFGWVAAEIAGRAIDMRTNNRHAPSSLLPDGSVNPQYQPGGQYYAPPISLADTIGGNYGGSGSGGSGSNLDRLAGTEADILATQEDVINQLLALAQGFEPTPIGRLNTADNPFIDEDMLGTLEARPDLELLRQILGFSAGTDASRTSATLGQQQSLFDQKASSKRSQDQGKFFTNLFTTWLNNRGNKTDATDAFTSQTDAQDQGYHGFG